MAKMKISAVFQAAAKEALKTVSAVRQGEKDLSPPKAYRKQTPRQKSAHLGKAAVTAKVSRPILGDPLRLPKSPAAVLKDLGRKNKGRNKERIHRERPLLEMAAAEPHKKISKEILKKIRDGAGKDNKNRNPGQKQFLPVLGYRITSGFGEDRGDHRHSGIDLAVAEGTAVAAVKSGTVVFAGWSGGYGYRIVIDHGDGSESSYSHLSDIGVAKGETVGAGRQIGLTGNTGHSTGPHLHFEIKVDGKYINPESYFDFGNGLAAKSDGIYVSKLATAAKAAKAATTPWHKPSSLGAPRPGLTLPAVKAAAKKTAAFSPPQPLLPAVSRGSHGNGVKAEKAASLTADNPLISLVFTEEKKGVTRRTKPTAATKRRK